MPTTENIEEICEQVAEGSTLTKIGKNNKNGLPGEGVLYKWLREADVLLAGIVSPITDETPDAEEEKEYRAGVIEFQKCYARAREQRADYRADEVDETIEAVKAGEMEPHAARVIIDGHKWLAGKEKPSVYSDKHQMEVTGKDGGPIETSNKSLALAILGVIHDGGQDVQQLLEKPDKQLEHSPVKGVESKE